MVVLALDIPFLFCHGLVCISAGFHSGSIDIIVLHSIFLHFFYICVSPSLFSVRSLSKSAGKRLTSSHSSSRSPLPPLPSRTRTISGGGSKKLQV